MECVNRLYSYLTKINYVKALSLENNSKSFSNLYVIVDDNSDVYEKIKLDIFNFVNENNLFNIINCNNNEMTFVSNDFISLKVFIVSKLTSDLTQYILYNPNDLKPLNETLADIAMIKSMNTVFYEFSNFINYSLNKDNIQAFNALVKVNDYVISYMFAYYLNKSNKGLLNELIKELPKNINLKFKNYISLLKYERTVECAKMILWFVDDFITNIPIVIATHINIDFYFEIKQKILSL